MFYVFARILPRLGIATTIVAMGPSFVPRGQACSLYQSSRRSESCLDRLKLFQAPLRYSMHAKFWRMISRESTGRKPVSLAVLQRWIGIGLA